MERPLIDLEQLAEQARAGCVPILNAVLAKGVSLYGGDGQGNLVAISPDGHKYAVAIRSEQPVRILELGLDGGFHR